MSEVESVQDPSKNRLLVGDVIAGKYRIESIAGEGGMGIVYEAEHVILRQRVAVKALAPSATMTAEAIERFSLEASAIARITSEHVVRVMDAGSLPNGAPYLVMEYLDGSDLRDLLSREGALPPAEVVDFTLQALEALAHAHAAHVIHRDLKPANLFLATCPDGRQIIKLVDFGISKSFDTTMDEGRILGSPVYMSPEQLESGPIDERTDLWSLGVVMYELLAGFPPFVGGFVELVTSIRERDAVPLRRKAPNVSQALSDVIARCLKRDREARFRSCAELARALLPHGTGAWKSSLERIERALSNVAPVRAPRRFESFDGALSALDSEWNPQARKTLAPPDEEAMHSLSNIHSVEVFVDTIPAPPSEWRKSKSDLPTSPPSSAKTVLRILIVEESHVALRTHEDYLTSAGFDVRATSSVRSFETFLESWKPHLVLVGADLPDMRGDELCRRIKAKFRATMPVVLLSEDPRDMPASPPQVSGADAFFSKMTERAALVDFVRNICAMTYSPEDLPDF